MAEGKRGTQVSLIILITVLIFKSTSQCSQWCCLTSLHSTNTGSNGKFQFLLYYISQLKHPSILVLPTLNVNRYDNNIWYDSAWARVTFLRSFHFSLLLPLLVISQLLTYSYMYNVITFITLFLHARVMTKNLFNPQFGSIFRTCHNPTYFSRRLCRFSDLYMTSLSCLLNYDLSYTFYPRRTPLQHEAPLWMDQLCTGCMKTPFLEEMSHIRWEPESHKWLIRFYVF